MLCKHFERKENRAKLERLVHNNFTINLKKYFLFIFQYKSLLHFMTVEEAE